MEANSKTVFKFQVILNLKKKGGNHPSPKEDLL